MGSEEYRRFEFHYGLVMLRTRRFQSIMDRLGRSRISRPAGWVLLYLMPVAAAMGFFLFISLLTVLLSPRGHAVSEAIRGIGPLANLGLPGINPYLPIVDGWIALIVAMVVHEGAHGIIARSLGLPVKASGLLFFFVLPVGAFVDVDDTAIRAARNRDSSRVLAAGASVNLVLAAAALLLLVGLVSAMTPAASGVAISSVVLPSPSAKAGILPGDYIVAVNGIYYTDGGQFLNASWYRPGQIVNVTIWREGSTRVIPLTVGARPNTTLSCVTPMTVGVAGSCTAMVSGFLGDIGGEKVYFDSNGTGIFSAGYCVIVGNSCGVEFTPTSAASPSQNITAAYEGDTYNRRSYGSYVVMVQAAASPAAASAAVANVVPSSRQGTPGSSDPLGYIGTTYISNGALKSIVTGYSAPLQNILQYTCIPTLPACQSRVPFSDNLELFYTSPLGRLTVPLANLLYWLFFINFNLAIFNAFPIYPLDGGQAFRVGVKALGRDRLSEGTLTYVTMGATLAVLAMLLAVIVGPYFL